MAVFFENIWVLLTVAGVALVVVSVIRQAKPEWGYWPLLIPLALAGLAFGLDAAVTTDTEALNHIIAVGKQAAVSGDVQLLMTVISPDYTGRSHRSKAALQKEAERVFERASIEKIKTQSHLLTQKGNTAHSKLNIVVHMDSDNRYTEAGSLVFVGVDIDYEKRGEKWYIRSVEVVSVNNQPWNR